MNMTVQQPPAAERPSPTIPPSIPSWQDVALVIVPTYNEAENIANLVTQLRALPGNVHVLVVDDNSPDGTGQIVTALATHDAGIHLLHRPKKEGLGEAYKAGFREGLQRGYLYLCTMDADFSHDPARIPDLLTKASTDCDLVVGSRYVPGGKIVDSTAFRKLISYGANWLAHTLLGIHIRDCTAGFRCYRRRVLEAIDLDSIFSSGYSFLIEMGFHCQQAGFRIGEVPITFVNRRMGNSKINRLEIYKAFYTLLRLRTSALPWQRMEDFYHRGKERRT